MVWNPLETLDPVTVPLECSQGAASATFQPWSARERIAYEDALSMRIVAVDPDSDDDADASVRLGTMKLVRLALTIKGVEGFPDTCRVTNADGSTESVRFNPTDERCLLALDSVTFDELVRHASRISEPGRDDAEQSADDAEEGAQGSGEASSAGPTKAAAPRKPRKPRHSPTPSTPPTPELAADPSTE